jgi:hypothetical protein
LKGRNGKIYKKEEEAGEAERISTHATHRGRLGWTPQQKSKDDRQKFVSPPTGQVRRTAPFLFKSDTRKNSPENRRLFLDEQPSNSNLFEIKNLRILFRVAVVLEHPRRVTF